jgi:Metallo-beta-lactamase superfamily
VNVRNASAGKPEADELEVSIFGPSLGETTVVHVGDGDWIIVDSCLAEDNAARPLEYLESLGVRPERDVVLVVATHWHDDHIGGMANVVRRCKKAKFAVSAAFTKHDFNAVVELVEPAMSLRSGVREFWEIWGYLEEFRRPPTQASGGKELLFRRQSPRVKVWALSPSDRDIWLGLRRFKAFYDQAVGGVIEYVPPLNPNDASVVVWITVEDSHILLGADLKTYRRALRGWKAILDDVGVWHGQTASVFKIPHHGSMGSYEPRVWDEMLVSDPVGLLTPFVQGKVELPATDGVDAILGHTSKAYITSSEPPHIEMLGPVRQTVEESTTNYVELAIVPGQVRLRKSLGGGSWSVDLFGPAARLPPV